jgi:adenylosuccinate lyase
MDVEQYSTAHTRHTWSHTHTTHLRQRLWIQIARAQRLAGLNTPDLTPYCETANRYVTDPQYHDQYDADHTDELANTQHETVAALRTFEKNSGNHGALHWGLTSSDISENTQQRQILESARHTISLGELLISQLGVFHTETKPMAGRTHNVPAQEIRFADRIDRAICETAHGIRTLHTAIETYPRRGLAGAVGTNADLLHLLHGDRDALASINQRVFSNPLRATGQCYPRSWDLPILAGALATVSGAASLATTLRLMLGQNLITLTRDPNQIGSSAMAHKANPIEAERIQGLHRLMLGYHTSLAATTGCTWNEGDISDSSTRRIALPGFFHTTSGILLNASRMLHKLGFNDGAIHDEHTRHSTRLRTGLLLATAIEAGSNRTDAHTAILEAYNTNDDPQPIATALGADDRIKLTAEDAYGILITDK